MKGVNETYKLGKSRSERTVNASSWFSVVSVVFISNRTKCCQLAVIRRLLFPDVCPLSGEEKILTENFLSFIFFLRCAKLYKFFSWLTYFAFDGSFTFWL
jgi:hypothetical protein